MPGLAVVMGATLQCTTGAEPSELVVDPLPVIAGEMPVATIIDGVGGVNILPFGVCELIGICVPATVAWVPEDPTMLIDFIPIVTQASICPCLIGAAVAAVTGAVGVGIVFVVEPANFTVLIA
jgi:hypothetical protein